MDGNFIGGDHSITWPLVEGFLQRHKKLQVLHLDAHSDLGLDRWGIVEHGSFARRLLEDDRVHKVLQIGVRGPQDREICHDKLRICYGKSLTFVEGYLDPDVPTYVSVDCDVFDPSCFPGVAFPVPGGLTSEDFSWIMRHIAPSLDLVAMDWVEYTPHRDPSCVSVSTLSYAILEGILALAKEFK